MKALNSTIVIAHPVYYFSKLLEKSDYSLMYAPLASVGIPIVQRD
jgi:hypothetical protein